MENPYEERIRIEMTYPQGRQARFGKIREAIDAKYPGAEIKGTETDRNGSEVMIALVSVPKSLHPVPAAAAEGTESDPKHKPFEFTKTADVHEFVSNLIEEYSEEA